MVEHEALLRRKNAWYHHGTNSLMAPHFFTSNNLLESSSSSEDDFPNFFPLLPEGEPEGVKPNVKVEERKKTQPLQLDPVTSTATSDNVEPTGPTTVDKKLRMKLATKTATANKKKKKKKKKMDKAKAKESNSETIYSYLTNHGLPDANQIISWVEDILTQIEKLHASLPPLYHGNITLKNCALDDHLSVSLINPLKPETGNMPSSKKPRYPAPELKKRGTFRNGDLWVLHASPKIDIWSFGVALYRLITNNNCNYWNHKGRRVLSIDYYQIPRQYSAFAKMIDKCLRRRPKRRPTAFDLRVKLRNKTAKILKAEHKAMCKKFNKNLY